MTRRSARLVFGGHDTSEQDSDSSAVTNISYSENPGKVFKKRGGSRQRNDSPSSTSRTNDRSVTAEQHDEMTRRSSRLMSGGVDDSDEETDSNPSPQISYREQHVKVFKKRGGNRKRTTSTSSISRCNDRPATPPTEKLREPPPQQEQQQQQDGVLPSSSRRPARGCSTGPTPRPAISRSSSRSNTPALPSEQVQRRALNSHVETSGYSSSEGLSRRSPPPPQRTAMGPSVSSLITRSASVVCHVTASGRASLCGQTMKRWVLILFLLLLLLGVCWFLPFSSITSSLKPLFSPVKVGLDPDAVDYSLHAKVAHVLLDMKQKQEDCLTEIKTNMQNEIQLLKEQLEVVNVLEVSALHKEISEQHANSNSFKFQLERLEAKNKEIKTNMQNEIQLLKEQLEVVNVLEVSALHKEISEQHANSNSFKFQLERLEAKNKEIKTNMQNEIQLLKEQLEVVNVLEVSALHKEISEQHANSNSFKFQLERLEAKNKELYDELSSIKAAPTNTLSPELQKALEQWFSARVQEYEARRSQGTDFTSPPADRMADFTLESQGGSVVGTRCSETYNKQSSCVTIFGFPLWYPSESPRTVIQGHPVLLPGRCWAFRGVQGQMVVALSHPVIITHVTLDHIPRFISPVDHINSAPKDFQVYGMNSEDEPGTLLGKFTYKEDGEATQTFQLNKPSDVHDHVELRILSNWGQIEYTCLYRFRVHGKMAST